MINMLKSGSKLISSRQNVKLCKIGFHVFLPSLNKTTFGQVLLIYDTADSLNINQLIHDINVCDRFISSVQ